MLRMKFYDLTHMIQLGLLGIFLISWPVSAEKEQNKNLDFSPPDVIHWQTVSAQSYQDSYVVVKIHLETKHQFGIYEDKLTVIEDNNWFYSHNFPPITESVTDPVTQSLVNVYKGGEFILVFQGMELYTQSEFSFYLKYVGCSSKICLFPYKEKITVRNQVLSENIPNHYKKPISPNKPTVNSDLEKKPQQKNTKDHTKEAFLSFDEDSFNSLKAQKSLDGFLFFLLFLFLAGLATNLTPCVYPMIPITIRILANQKKSPLLASSLYALGIMLTYTTLGVAAALTGTLFGQLIANFYFSLFLSLIMFLLAISMLGYGSYSWLQTIGNKFSGNGYGLKTSFVMGLGAGLIASPCTGPILAALLTYSVSTSESSAVIFYLLTYSFGFSLPYVILGKTASRLSQIRFKTSIQTTTKIIFAAVMFSLFFYYLRIPFYSFHKKIDHLWLEISTVSFICFLLLYFIGQRKKLKFVTNTSVLVLGLSFFGSTQLLTSSTEKLKLKWYADERTAFAKSHSFGKPILVDMWAEWCEVCKKMDQTTFSDPKVIKLLNENKWILLKLDLTETTDENEIIYKKYDLMGLPTLVILPKGNIEDKVLLKGFVDSSLLLKRINQYSKD